MTTTTTTTAGARDSRGYPDCSPRTSKTELWGGGAMPVQPRRHSIRIQPEKRQKLEAQKPLDRSFQGHGAPRNDRLCLATSERRTMAVCRLKPCYRRYEATSESQDQAAGKSVSLAQEQAAEELPTPPPEPRNDDAVRAPERAASTNDSGNCTTYLPWTMTMPCPPLPATLLPHLN